MVHHATMSNPLLEAVHRIRTAPRKGSGRPRRTEPDERTSDMILRYKAGETLQSIGNTYHITRERVRQIMSKQGICGADGGAMIQALLNVEDNKIKRAATKERQEQRKRKQWGISIEEWKRIRKEFGYKPFSAYQTQKKNSAKRNIEWAMPFNEWWRIWSESGKWGKRGRGYGYQMCRLGDTGGYSPENVYITKGDDNIRDYHLVPANKKKWRRKYLAAQRKMRNGA